MKLINLRGITESLSEKDEVGERRNAAELSGRSII